MLGLECNTKPKTYTMNQSIQTQSDIFNFPKISREHKLRIANMLK